MGKEKMSNLGSVKREWSVMALSIILVLLGEQTHHV